MCRKPRLHPAEPRKDDTDTKGDRSNLSTSQPFPSALPPFVHQEPTSKLEHHSSSLRMLRVSRDALPATLRHLTGYKELDTPRLTEH
ncbi:Alstrom syndrome protein 1 homolog isoform X2 [Nannospalax galili]|uniref:Alstrom syndrome protein 1 homolog isoform X2 n=1 Tax=Nannospalax galili TaxID=1026970 RepID=UPI00111C846B|nr:Alstrom syndrome protein 1 homolog isoform X2 [Nannospalax galili]